MRRLPVLVVLAALAGAAPSAAAQAKPKPFVFGITANALSIDPTAAASQMVGARSWGMQFDGGVTFARYLFAGVDFAPNRLSDKAGFTQNTTGGEKSSSAMLMYFSAMVGARTAPVHVVPGVATSIALYGGHSATAGERSISECIDCTTEDIRISAGNFVQPTVVFGGGNTRVRTSGRYYLGDTGLRSVLSAGIEVGGR